MPSHTDTDGGSSVQFLFSPPQMRVGKLQHCCLVDVHKLFTLKAGEQSAVCISATGIGRAREMSWLVPKSRPWAAEQESWGKEAQAEHKENVQWGEQDKDLAHYRVFSIWHNKTHSLDIIKEHSGVVIMFFFRWNCWSEVNTYNYLGLGQSFIAASDWGSYLGS